MDIIKNEGNLLGVYDVLEMGESTSVGFQVESGLSFMGKLDIWGGFRHWLKKS